MSTERDLEIIAGDTYAPTIRWETSRLIYRPITAVTKTAPVRVTAVAHNLRDGWRAGVVSVEGMTEINASASPPPDEEMHACTVVDSDIIEFNTVNASGYSSYASGGYLVYYEPQDLSGYTARMHIRNRIGGDILYTLTTENGGIVLDNTNHTISLTFSAADTAAFSWRKGVYDLEMVSPDVVPVVKKLYHGVVAITREVTLN